MELYLRPSNQWFRKECQLTKILHVRKLQKTFKITLKNKVEKIIGLSFQSDSKFSIAALPNSYIKAYQFFQAPNSHLYMDPNYAKCQYCIKH